MPRSVLENENCRVFCLGCKISGAGNGTHGRASRAPIPQAKAFGRIPKNRPLGGFLDGIPPHRFESRYVPENKKAKVHYLG